MERIHHLNGIPGYLIHGRRDVSSPVITPWKLHQRWEGSRLIIVENEGHGGPESMAALVAAVEDIAAALSGADVDAELQIRLAQAHATLALALETRAAAYDTRTAAYVTYLATLKTEARSDNNQHAAVVAKLVRGRLGFEAE